MIAIAATHAPVAVAVVPHDRAGVGGTEAIVLVMIAVAAAVYLRGLARLWRAGRGRGVAVAHAAAFAAGLAVLVIAAGGPLEASVSRSFAVHMIQHEALMLVVAPLLVIARPLAIWAWALPRRMRSRLSAPLHGRALTRIWAVLTGVAGASLLQLAVVLAWHLPRLFDAAATDVRIHAAQHACFVAAALCFWWAMLRAARGARSFAAVASLFVTMIATGALGAALAFAPTVLYASYAIDGAAALESQQLGGVIMWVPGGLVYMAAALAIAARALARPRPPLAANRVSGRA